MAKDKISKIRKEPSVWKIYLPMIPRTGFDLQNIQRTHMTPLQEDKQPNEKMRKGP